MCEWMVGVVFRVVRFKAHAAQYSTSTRWLLELNRGAELSFPPISNLLTDKQNGGYRYGRIKRENIKCDITIVVEGRGQARIGEGFYVPRINFLFLIFRTIFRAMASNNKQRHPPAHTVGQCFRSLPASHAYLLPFFMGPRLTGPASCPPNSRPLRLPHCAQKWRRQVVIGFYYA